VKTGRARAARSRPALSGVSRTRFGEPIEDGQPAGHLGFGCHLAHLGGCAAHAAAVGSSASVICRRRSS
jgi:hypothetical protein